jgi:hypothetical protein
VGKRKRRRNPKHYRENIRKSGLTIYDPMLLRPFLSESVDLHAVATPVSHPRAGELLPIRALFDRMRRLVGGAFDDTGYDQERNRGATLHRLVCRSLGYAAYQDDGQFPDVRHQLLEVKLQTSPTIDLGLVRPDSTEPLDVPQIEGKVLNKKLQIHLPVDFFEA